MQIILDPNSIESYRTFLKIKRLPTYSIKGSMADFPDEYASLIGAKKVRRQRITYEPLDGLFDYQSAIAKLAIRKRKFAIFADCGLGKTLIFLEFAKHVQKQLKRSGKRVLIISPLMVIEQTINECNKFYGNDLPIEKVPASGLQDWLDSSGPATGITNYDALSDAITQGNLGGLILDESSMLKSHYGKWGTKCLELGVGLDWKLACTGTPAPNDRIEFANHAVFMDAYSSPNAFLASFFVNRGQTGERWELKDHALEPFYRALSHWCIFLTNPATYGWTDNSEPLPPIHTHYHNVDLTSEQRAIIGKKTGELFTTEMGGITSRSVMGQIAKGHYKGKDISTNKPDCIRELIHSWPEESTIVWCIYNNEQKRLAKELPEAESIDGSTPHEKRQDIIRRFKSGELKTVISKPKILGFGLNLQVATRQVFSGLQDSYELFYQAVKRSNRYGSSRPLNVHIPLTDVEEPMVANVMRKAKRVDIDAEEQERIFNTYGHIDIR